MFAKFIDSEHDVEPIKVSGYCNRGEWFGKTWLIGISFGYNVQYYVVESSGYDMVLDEFVDSDFGHLLKVDEGEPFETWHFLAGNFGDRVDLSDVLMIKECEIFTS